jgi:uncharacterized membrane protein HdeD (DUF308 family)
VDKEVNNMKNLAKLGFILLGIFLIAYGLVALFGLSFSGLPIVMGILAIAAGVLIIFGK